LHKGNIMLRDDSAMNLSPAMFEEFIRPYDERLLGYYGGGAIHFCGHGDHYISSMCAMPGMYAIAMSQPELNDMERIYQATVDRGVKLLGLRRSECERALAAGRDLRGQVHSA
jgi:uroporphyrinogen-III decarboxylase